MIYLDSSAILKALIDEPESDALAEWLASNTHLSKITSELSWIEVLRACRRIDESTVPTARRLLSGLDIIPISHEIAEMAAMVNGHSVRSLDAIHLASALILQPGLAAFVTYDLRLKEAASSYDLAVACPA